MEFQIVTSIEKLAHIALQGFEGQIRILHTTGPSSDRAQHIENLKRMLDYLKRTIEEERDEVIETIEACYSSFADDIANQKKFTERAAASSNDASVQNFSKKLAVAQPLIIKTLGAQETKIEKEVLDRFKSLLEKIEEIKSRIEKMQR